MKLPKDFENEVKTIFGDQWLSFCESLNKETPTSIRLNPEKQIPNQTIYENPVPWCNSGYYLAQRPLFTFDPLLHAGCYYVQEASSMFIEQALSQHTKGNLKVLDLCAAPGGKSTLTASCISEESLLISNEIIKSRANVLAENNIKWGKANVVTTSNAPTDFGKYLPDYFDVILTDVPCSGEGMFRKDEKAIQEWSLQNVYSCRERQRQIINDIWNALKPGGILIFSTCTYNTLENEENIKWITNKLGAECLSIDIKPTWNISPSLDKDVMAYRFFPHKTIGEGLFLSVLQKNSSQNFLHKPKNSENIKNKRIVNNTYLKYIKEPDRFTLYDTANKFRVIPSNLYHDLVKLNQKLNIIHAGITLGELKGTKFIPDHSLSLSNYINKTELESIEIDWDTAISYLRKEPLIVPNAPKGFILITFRSQPLGFVNNIGNRANNLYPQEWRIRTSNIPPHQVSVL